MRTSLSPRAAVSLALPLLLLFLIAAGCSSDDAKSGTATTTAEQRTCDAWSGVVSAFDSFQSVDIINEGLDSARSYVTGLETSVQELSDAASAQLQPEVDALKTAITDLEDTLKAGTSASQIGSALDRVNTAWNQLVTSLKTDCSSVDAEAT